MSALIQGTPEWLEMRKHCIGASDAPIIMGVSPWTTEYQLWQEKLDLKNPSLENAAMKRGKVLEAEARSLFEKETGLIVFPVVMFHPQYPWMLASLDGMDIEQQNIVEIKCPGSMDHSIALDGRVPDKYYPQLQHQMEVCGVDQIYYYSYYPYPHVDGENIEQKFSTKIITVYRDQKYINAMIEKEKMFLACMRDLTPPDLSDKDYSERDDAIWVNTAESWKSVKKRIEELELQEKELRNMLVYQCEGANCKGAGVKVSKIARKGTVDYLTIPELKDVDLDKYRKAPIESWRLSEIK